MKNQKGLTLIEMMISMVVLVLVLTGSLMTLTSAHQMSEDSRTRLLALNAARSTLEAVKNTALTGVPAINTAAFVPADLPNGNVVILTNPVGLAGVNVATVTVRVTWTGAKNRPQTMDVTTMRSAFT